MTLVGVADFRNLTIGLRVADALDRLLTTNYCYQAPAREPTRRVDQTLPTVASVTSAHHDRSMPSQSYKEALQQRASGDKTDALCQRRDLPRVICYAARSTCRDCKFYLSNRSLRVRPLTVQYTYQCL